MCGGLIFSIQFLSRVFIINLHSDSDQYLASIGPICPLILNIPIYLGFYYMRSCYSVAEMPWLITATHLHKIWAVINKTSNNPSFPRCIYGKMEILSFWPLSSDSIMISRKQSFNFSNVLKAFCFCIYQ